MKSQPFDQSTHAFTPIGTLHGGRYTLLKEQGHRHWNESTSEMWWLAQDNRAAGGSSTLICEVSLPESGFALQQKVHPAIRAMLSTEISSSLVRLSDVFLERGHCFFVFHQPEGETLIQCMQRRQSVLSEQEVIACCLQIVEILDRLSQHTPPISHGFISPASIVTLQVGSEPTDVRWVLTQFSLLVACHATYIRTNQERFLPSPFSPPECARGIFTPATDLYALLATAYYAVTGSIPAPARQSLVPARQLNPALSQDFSDLLQQGLQPAASARFQQPAELYRTLGGGAITHDRRKARQRTRTVTALKPGVEPVSPLKAPHPGWEAVTVRNERTISTPNGEARVSPSRHHNELMAAGWVAGILLAEALLVFAAH